MKTIRQWISDNPWTAVLLSWLFGSTSAVAGCRPDWFWYMVGIFGVGLFIMVFSMMWRWTTPIGLALALAIPAMPAKAEEPRFEPAGMAGVAVVVVCVGGVFVYILVKTCQKVFPKTPAPTTNDPPNVVGGAMSDDTAGAWTYGAVVSCYELQSEAQWPTVTLELSGVIEENEHGPFFNLQASRRMAAAEATQDIFGFQADLARHGIAMPPVGGTLFGRNGQAAYEAETPIRFGEDSNGRHVATVNSDTAPSVPMVIQRSYDLQTWSDLGFVSVPIGQRFKMIDATSRQAAFYRIQPR